MIQSSKITEAVYENLIEIFMNRQQQKDIDQVLLRYMGVILRETPQWVVHDSNWQGFLVMYKKGGKITFNPWLFGGLPICKGDPSLATSILNEAIRICKNQRAIEKKMSCHQLDLPSQLVMILNHNTYLDYKDMIDHDFIYDYDYCDMELDLKNLQISEIDQRQKTISSICKIVPLNEIPVSEVKQLYHQTFAKSDAKFYSLQTTMEKVEFFSYLNYDLAIKCDETLGILWHNQFIGFSLVIDSEDCTRNINCMCIKPTVQDKGFGTLLLEHIIGLSMKAHVKKILLGTETQMKAFNLYRKKGFHVTGTSNYYHYDL